MSVLAPESTAMALFQFSALPDGSSISFNPTADVLNFDQVAIAAADLRVSVEGANARVSVAPAGTLPSGRVHAAPALPFGEHVHPALEPAAENVEWLGTVSCTMTPDASRVPRLEIVKS